MRTTALLTAAAAVLVIAACGDDDDGTSRPAAPVTTEAATTTEEPSETLPPVTGEATVRIETHPELGEHLVDGAGLTLYVFALDDGVTTACTDGCVDLWPPLVVDDPVAGDGIAAAELGVADGIEPGHVTYHGQLLYYYVADEEPGSIIGTQIPEWYAVRPDGSAIRPAAATTGPGGY